MDLRAASDDDFNVFELWRAFLTEKWTIAISALAGTALAMLAALLMTPIYRANVLLMPQSDSAGSRPRVSGQLGGLASLAGIGLQGSGNEKNRAIAVVRSRAFIEEFIREEELLPVLFEEIWDAQTKSWTVDDPSRVPTMGKAVKRFNEIFSVTEDLETGQVTVSVEWKSPELAAAWANRIVAKLNERMRSNAIVEATQSAKHLGEEAERTNVLEVQQAIYSRIADQIELATLATVRHNYAFDVLDPAVPPELDEYVRPKRLLMVAVGLALGIIIGTSVVALKMLVTASGQYFSRRESENVAS